MNSRIKQLLKPAILSLLSLGLNRRQTLALRNWPRYNKHYNEFQRLGGKVARHHVILNDFNDQAGSAKGHYFHQDLLVANLIHQKNPVRHIDIGSRVDGFVAHVAAYRPIEVIDVRDLKETDHKNIIFTKADLMTDQKSQHEITDSLSCLHAIEHFGLGRYGDPIDPQGHIKGFNNMIAMLKRDGTLYVSCPIGIQNEVHFNAHRIFHPTDILSWSYKKDKLRLERFDFVDDAGHLHQKIDIFTAKIDVKHGCGIYTFTKLY
jgi:hypothetical protein